MSRTICILYGINEGPFMGKRFTVACKAAGLQVIADPERADVLFAHSGGCYVIPKYVRAERILLSGLPYWPGRPWLQATALKVLHEWQLSRRQQALATWAVKWLYHALYAFNFKAAIRMALNRNFNHPWNSTKSQLIIRNQDDTYCSPDVLRAPFNGPRTFLSLPGGHDDCWINPTRYIDLLRGDS